jgi:hypothetical protein
MPEYEVGGRKFTLYQVLSQAGYKGNAFSHYGELEHASISTSQSRRHRVIAERFLSEQEELSSSVSRDDGGNVPHLSCVYTGSPPSTCLVEETLNCCGTGIDIHDKDGSMCPQGDAIMDAFEEMPVSETFQADSFDCPEVGEFNFEITGEGNSEENNDAQAFAGRVYVAGEYEDLEPTKPGNATVKKRVLFSEFYRDRVIRGQLAKKPAMEFIREWKLLNPIMDVMDMPNTWKTLAKISEEDKETLGVIRVLPAERGLARYVHLGLANMLSMSSG